MERAHAPQSSSEPAVEGPQPSAAAGLPAALTPATAIALQRAIGNRGVAQLARQPRTAPPPIKPVVESFDDVVTYTDAAQNYRMGALLIQQDIAGSTPRATSSSARTIWSRRPGTRPSGTAPAATSRSTRSSSRACARGSPRSATCARTSRGSRGRRAARPRARPSASPTSTRSSSRSCSTPPGPGSATTTTR